ncbi:unnamed protein product, partial [Symbiodinium sp. CCMP2456]
AAPMLFPMYTIPCELLLQMTTIQPHEQLKAKGDVIIFDPKMGKAAFVSHQWTAEDHPDPELKQLQVMKDAFRHLLHDTGIIPLDPVTEAYVPTAKHLSMQEFKSRPLFIWYDYFSCPQLEHRENRSAEGTDLAKAISSIPAYIAQCSFVFGLCPVLTCQNESGLLSQATWSRRGWCRLERALREFSLDDKWVMVKSARSMEFVGSALQFVSGSVGEGEFTKEEDRKKLASVLRQAVLRKMMFCLKAQDLPGYRRHLNLQSTYFRGLRIEPVRDIVPGYEAAKETDSVAEFFYQNGFVSVRDIDKAGWSPLHYAAMNGDPALIDGLLRQHADPNKRTAREQPKLGCPPWMSALDLTMQFKQNDAARLLIAARAKLDGPICGPQNYAGVSDNAEGMRLLCAAGMDPHALDFLNAPAIQACSAYGSIAAMGEVVMHSPHDTVRVSRALVIAMAGGGGTAEMVVRLLELRADVNHQYQGPNLGSPQGLLAAAKSLQYRCGSTTALSSLFYHLPGMTPLMAALLTAQYEAAAALIDSGARLDLKNCRNWTAADFAKGQSLPDFLVLGLEGDPLECRRVTSLALAAVYLEI